MFNLADAILNNVPLPHIPFYLTQYHPGQTPLSEWPYVVATLASYLAVVFGIREIMRKWPPQKLTFLFQLHNIALSAVSGLLLVLMVEEVLPIVWNNGLFYGMCNSNSWTQRLEFYYMINYYIKYWELLDTVFLALKKKPLAFLHVFHHSATALLCFTQLSGKTSVSWVPIVLNLTVHVIMYYYYFATAGGRRIWWKKYLTTMQITQFVIDLFAVYLASYAYYVSTYMPGKLPTPGNCSGSESAAFFGCVLLTSYLGLFIQFYFQTYKKPAVRVGKANGKVNGHANGNGAINNIKQE